MLALVAVHAARGHWIGDFWEHSAVVRELASHPTHPRHPLLLVDAPHAFASPYALLVAVLCRITGVSSVTGLAVASIINLLMLFVALRLFARRFAPDHAEAVGYYLLLFMLLLWGPEPWEFSGFYHILALNHVLAYPSACAFWVSLLLLALNERRVKEGEPRLLLVTVPLTAFVLLVHPPVFLFVATGIAASTLEAKRRSEMIVGGLSLATAVAIALTWPYFPLWELLTRGSAAFNANNAVMYSQPLLRTFPALVGVPLVIANARRTGRWSMTAWLMMLIGIYAFGFVTKNYNYGRVLFFVVFLLQLAIARFVAQVEARVQARDGVRSARLVAGTVVVACLVLSEQSLVSTAWDTLRAPRAAAGYQFLARYVGQYDVMMADWRTGWIAASFGGKLVSAQHPLAFVPEAEQGIRRDDVRTFFDAGTSRAEREALLRKYGVSYVLAPRRDALDSTLVSDDTVRALGRLAHEDDRFLLVRIDAHAGR